MFIMRGLVLAVFLFSLAGAGRAQSFNYWTRNFNEESSLASGAVVGGGAGPSAIYYNPAGIGEKANSQLSIHASLFSINIYDIKNALGDGVDLSNTQFLIEPRFISYMVKPHPRWNLEFAFLNNENYNVEMNTSLDMYTDVLEHLEGEERYFARFQFLDRYRDDWVGLGASYEVSPSFHLGVSMMVPVRQIDYTYLLDLEAMPLSDDGGGHTYPYYVASYQEEDYFAFNNYRLLWKAGFQYRSGAWSFGITVTTPSVNVYADGKRVSRKRSRNNIMDPDTLVMLPNYTLVDYNDKKNVRVNFKSPFSVAAGATVMLPTHRHQTLYFTSEFFGALAPYPIVEADEKWEPLRTLNWLTYYNAGKAVVNVAAGYDILVKENIRVMGGFRTDFNSRKNVSFSPEEMVKRVRGLTLDIYRISGGAIFTFKGQDIIAGLQYSIGRETGQQQFANLKEPVEYNKETGKPLQGTPANNMRSLINNINLYFGATFNFNKKEK
jgi:hypothetical protein